MAVDKKNIRNFIYRKVLDFALNDENLSGDESLTEGKICEICQINLEELEAWLTSKKQIPQEKIVKLLLHLDLFKLQYDSLFGLQKPIISLTAEAIKKAAEYDEYLNEINNFWEYALSFESKEEEKNRNIIIEDFDKYAITLASQGIQSFIYLLPPADNMFVLNEDRSKYSPAEWAELLKKNNCVYEDICHSFEKRLEENYFDFTFSYLDEYLSYDEDEDEDEDLKLNKENIAPFDRAVNSNESCFSYLSDLQKKNLFYVELSLEEIYEYKVDEDTFSFVNYRSLGWLAGYEGQKIVKNIFQQFVAANKKNSTKINLIVFDFNCLITLFDLYIKVIEAPKKYHKDLFRFRDHLIKTKLYKFTDALASIKLYLQKSESKFAEYTISNPDRFIFDSRNNKLINEIELRHKEALRQIAELFPYLSYIEKHYTNIANIDFPENYDFNSWEDYFEDPDGDLEVEGFISKPNNHFLYVLKEKLHIENAMRKVNTDIEDSSLVDLYLSRDEAHYFLGVLGYKIKAYCDKPHKGFHEITIEIS